MRKTRLGLAALLCALTVTFTACGQNGAVSSGDVSVSENPDSANSVSDVSAVSSDSLWDDALYTEDTEIGEGAHSVLIEVKAEEKSVTLTLRSDKDNLADILTENKIAEGEDSQYGLYIKKVNGILADFDVDGSYWGLFKDGEMTATGTSGITVSDGEHYELVYTPAA